MAGFITSLTVAQFIVLLFVAFVTGAVLCFFVVTISLEPEFKRMHDLVLKQDKDWRSVVEIQQELIKKQNEMIQKLNAGEAIDTILTTRLDEGGLYDEDR